MRAAPAWLIYGQGGVAWAQVQFRGHLCWCSTLADFSRTRTGWTAGGGVEWMFAPRWSAFLEGNYMDFGSNDQTVFALSFPVRLVVPSAPRRPRPLPWSA